MKTLWVFAAILALATAQWAPNTANQVSNANSGAGGTSIASGTANANQRYPSWAPYSYGGRWPSYYGYRPNTASQVSNANSGAGGTSIASGTANAGMGRDKRSPEPQYGSYPYYPYWGSYAPNTASQVSNANSGNLGTSIASGTSNANQYREKRSPEPQYAGYPYYPNYWGGSYAPNTANQVSNANSGFGGTSIASGTANANQNRPYREKRSPEPQYGGYPYYPYWGSYAPNTASQVSNANSGAGGTSIASGTANANQLRPYREKRTSMPHYGGYPNYGYWGNYAPNTANQVSNANSGFGGTSLASGTANANQYRPYRDSPVVEVSKQKLKSNAE